LIKIKDVIGKAEILPEVELEETSWF